MYVISIFLDASTIIYHFSPENHRSYRQRGSIFFWGGGRANVFGEKSSENCAQEAHKKFVITANIKKMIRALISNFKGALDKYDMYLLISNSKEHFKLDLY